MLRDFDAKNRTARGAVIPASHTGVSLMRWLDISSPRWQNTSCSNFCDFSQPVWDWSDPTIDALSTMQILIETRVRYKTPAHDLTSTLIARDDLHRAPLIVSAKALSA